MTDISAAREALMNYQQADMDGIMVLASRQAIHEATGHIDALEASNKALVGVLADYWTGNHFTGVSINDAERISAAIATAGGLK